MPLGGLAVGTGALPVSYSDIPGPYAQRARRMVAASVMCSLAVVAGGLAVRRPVFAVILVSVWAFVAGLAVCLGPTAESLGCHQLGNPHYLCGSAADARTSLSFRTSGSGRWITANLLSLLLVAGAPLPTRTASPVRFVYRAVTGICNPGPVRWPPCERTDHAGTQEFVRLGQRYQLEAERYGSLLNQAERID